MTIASAQLIQFPVPVVHHYPKLQMSTRDCTYARLMAVETGGRNSHILATMLANWSIGESVLPARMGLSRAAYQAMFMMHFPYVQWHEDPAKKGEMDPERLPEKDDLVQLLLESRAGEDPTEVWLAEIIAVACLGTDHLWYDMGLWSRYELTKLMELNFPALAKRNENNMKWKKFLYKQLCEKQEINACRAPSCDVCADYDNCFGSEESAG